MSFIVENTSGGSLDINDLGIQLATGEIIDLALSQDPAVITNSANGGDVETAINASDLTVKDPNDGVTNLSVADGLQAARDFNATRWGLLKLTGSVNESADGVKSFTDRVTIGNGPTTSAYALLITQSSNQAYIELQNNAGTGGAFFGLFDDNFNLWNFQGGDTVFYTGPSDNSATPSVTIKGGGSNGQVELNKGPLVLKHASNAQLDVRCKRLTWLLYQQGSNRWRLHAAVPELRNGSVDRR